ncbi:type VII secretion target [Actinoplanes sp. CA-015351]|uniref:type VII secretion target n=1 Tax=Actinoplanes sp. CA-015351 TaxID=3239897 RepID=UPI003D96D6AA
MRVTPEELWRHSAHLDDVTEKLVRARIAGDDTAMTPDAYGHLCVIVLILLEQVRAPLSEAIGAAARAVGTSATAIRRAADEYQLTDDLGAAELRGQGFFGRPVGGAFGGVVGGAFGGA